MHGKLEIPTTLSSKELDSYLEKGWFRMGQCIFTCNFLNFKHHFYNAIWLRLSLGNYQQDNTLKKLKKLNASFKIIFQPAEITQEKEDLYTKYKTGITFETSSSLKSLLLGDQENNVYNTFEICIYDETKLIACGFFDIGEISIAGIVSFYDPEYKKHSLGKYLIYNKIEYAISEGFTYFYPGYFAPTYPLFDYKLNIGKSVMTYLEVVSNEWRAIDEIVFDQLPLQEINDKLSEMEYTLFFKQIKFVKLKYEFYNGNNIPHLKHLDLFDYPEFIFVFSPNHEGFNPIIVYNNFDKTYKLLKCISVYHDENYESTDNYFGTHLMKISEELYTNSEAETFISLFMKE
jgi:arginine-tRNA-protein transferase